MKVQAIPSGRQKEVTRQVGEVTLNEGTRCVLCGKPVSFLNAAQCANCVEVTYRMEEFLKSAISRDWVRSKLKKYQGIDKEA